MLFLVVVVFTITQILVFFFMEKTKHKIVSLRKRKNSIFPWFSFSCRMYLLTVNVLFEEKLSEILFRRRFPFCFFSLTSFFIFYFSLTKEVSFKSVEILFLNYTFSLYWEDYLFFCFPYAFISQFNSLLSSLKIINNFFFLF